MEQLPNSMEQVEVKQESELTFRDIVDACIVFVCIPALILNVLFWAIATAFPLAGIVPHIMALLVTLLLALVGGILLVRYVDVGMLSYQGADKDPSGNTIMAAFGATIICIFLAVCIVGSLSIAGSLDSWQYILMPVEVLLVGYQTWRTFTSRGK
jgi:hypothetical protein